MSTGKMRLQYHPVLKKMSFEREENGRWVVLGSSRSLDKYMQPKTPQLLQNYSDEFLKDIVKSMDNISEISLDFRGTREDYEDLKKMIEHYQNSKRDDERSLSIGELTELAAVKDLFDDITSFSRETSAAFGRVVKESEQNWRQTEVRSISRSLKGELDKLNKKREGLSENAVNLCFVGGYSSGKSTLISALVGESILPEAIRSETAKMFKISQISRDSRETPSISLSLAGRSQKREVKIAWDEKGQVSLIGWPLDNPVRNEVQAALNETAGQALHLQIKKALTAINAQPGARETTDPKTGEPQLHDWYINGIVTIRYPFDLNAGVLFHIYDTPGTDSNNPEHLGTLKKALEDPASSILVYVNDPVKLEGTANAILMDILNGKTGGGEQGESSYGSTIDLSRSFFVINKADTLKDEQALKDLQEGTLRLNQTKPEAAKDARFPAAETREQKHVPLEIRLREKRLFFTDALHAGDARAVEKGVAGSGEAQRLKECTYLVDSDWRRFYKYDVMAQADADTERLKSDAEAELKKFPTPEEQLEQEKPKWMASFKEAVQRNAADEFEKQHPMPTKESFPPKPGAYYVCSGVYSLQREIERYAERFALAVRAEGIFKGTETLITDLSGQCERSENTLKTNIASLENQLATIKQDLTKKVEELCGGFGPGDISEAEEKDLGLTPEKILERQERLKEQVSECLDQTWFWGSAESQKFQEVKRNAKYRVYEAVSSFSSDHLQSRSHYLEKMQNELIEKIKQAIKAQEGLDQNTKNRLMSLKKRQPQGQSGNEPEFDLDFLDLLFFTHIDKEKTIDAAASSFTAEADKIKEASKKAFRQVKKDLIQAIQQQYQDHVDEFAGDIIRLKNDRDGFVRELEQLKKILADAQNRKKELMDKINREVEKEGKA